MKSIFMKKRIASLMITICLLLASEGFAHAIENEMDKLHVKKTFLNFYWDKEYVAAQIYAQGHRYHARWIVENVCIDNKLKGATKRVFRMEDDECKLLSDALNKPDMTPPSNEKIKKLIIGTWEDITGNQTTYYQDGTWSSYHKDYHGAVHKFNGAWKIRNGILYAGENEPGLKIMYIDTKIFVHANEFIWFRHVKK